MSFSSSFSTFVLTEIKHRIGWITLNRPEALNALNLEMTQRIRHALQAWEENAEVQAVILQGTGRAFCAGGDLRAIYQLYQQNKHQEIFHFFQEEYSLTRQIYAYSKPYIAILNGLTMGGGMGLAMPALYRIATEKAYLAMPETGIGFFPDVGASHFLRRCPGSIGLYLGLTGKVFNAREALDMGLITHFIDSQRLPDLFEQFHNLNHREEINVLLEKTSTKPNLENNLLPSQQIIDRCFHQRSLKEIFQALQKDPSPFAQETFAHLKTRSPLSLEVTFAHFDKAAKLNFAQLMQKELELSQKIVQVPDFMEGIRAAIVDKDHTPQWQTKILA